MDNLPIPAVEKLVFQDRRNGRDNSLTDTFDKIESTIANGLYICFSECLKILLKFEFIVMNTDTNFSFQTVNTLSSFINIDFER